MPLWIESRTLAVGTVAVRKTACPCLIEVARPTLCGYSRVARLCEPILSTGERAVGQDSEVYVGLRRSAAESRVQPNWVVPALDEAEASHPRLGLGSKAAPVEQLAFQRGKEAFAHGVVIRVTD